MALVSLRLREKILPLASNGLVGGAIRRRAAQLVERGLCIATLEQDVATEQPEFPRPFGIRDRRREARVGERKSPGQFSLAQREFCFGERVSRPGRALPSSAGAR